MRLLVLTNLYPPQNLGGFGLCIQRLTDAMKSFGYESITLTTNENYLGEAGLSNQVVRSLKLLGSYENGISQIEEGERKRSIKESNKNALSKIIKEFRDLVATPYIVY